MHITLNTNDCVNYLVEDNFSNWSLNGAYALVEYLEELEGDIGPIEFDVVALRCDYAEYSSAEEALREWLDPQSFREFQNDHNDGDLASTDEEREDAALEVLRDERGAVIEFSGGVIVSAD